MNSRDEFADVLESTVIRSSLPGNEQLALLKKILDYTECIIPKKLFKYRECTERNFSALDEDQIWVSQAISMNDGFDSRIFIDYEEVEEKIKAFFSREITNDQINKALSDMNSLYPGIEKLIKKELPIDEDGYDDFVNKYRTIIAYDIAGIIKSVPPFTQKVSAICCFSETISSSYMWGLYASSESGFAIEYDSQELKQASFLGKTGNNQLYPVVYRKERYKVSSEYIFYLLLQKVLIDALTNTKAESINKEATQIIMNNLFVNPDILVPLKVALHKSLNWESESEWRLFCPMDDNDCNVNSHRHYNQKAKGIYLGRRISSINEKILKAIAQEKDIPVYKMKLDDYSASYDLISERII